MVPIKGEWTPFADNQDQLEHYRLWGLIPPKSEKLRPIMVTDGYFGIPEPCKVVGYQTDTWAVIELDDDFHAIHGEYLAELQPSAHQKLPYGACFVDFLSKYIVIDIETTGFDFQNDRIIEIAAATYEYGDKVSEFHTLVNPCRTLPLDIVTLTGIQQEDVNEAPTLGAVSPSFLEYIGSLPLIGHNASTFDVPFLKAQIGQFDNPVIDTLTMSRKVFNLLSCHKLEYLKKTLSLNDSISHRALQDIETTNALLWACLSPRRFEAKVMRGYLDERLSGSSAMPKKSRSKNNPSRPQKNKFENVNIKTIVATCGSIDQTNPLYGKNIVFTGALSMTREDAMQLAVNCGAILKTSVSGKTNYLVVGNQDKTIVGADGMSSKEERAHTLNKSGKGHISVIDEREFICLARKEGAVV